MRGIGGLHLMTMGAEPFGQGAGGVDIVIHDKNALGFSGKPHPGRGAA